MQETPHMAEMLPKCVIYDFSKRLNSSPFDTKNVYEVHIMHIMQWNYILC